MVSEPCQQEHWARVSASSYWELSALCELPSLSFSWPLSCSPSSSNSSSRPFPSTTTCAQSFICSAEDQALTSAPDWHRSRATAWQGMEQRNIAEGRAAEHSQDEICALRHKGLGGKRSSRS